MKRVVVTGIGVISPLGNNRQDFFRALVEGRSGIRKLGTAWSESLATPLAGIVDCDLDEHFPKLKRIGLDRVTMLALLAARQAVAESGFEFSSAPGESAGLFWGTGMGGAAALESAYQDLLVAKATRLKPSTIVMVMNNAAAGQIGIEMGIRGPSYTYSQACSSSAVAIGEAYRAVRSGWVRSALAGGAEALLTQGVLKAWESLGTLARASADRPESACRPFAVDRSGFVLGEGAAALILEEESAARERGANILAEIVGYGNTNDASHITQPDSSGQARAMRAALAEAVLDTDQIDHINAHGTGTKVGDVVETRAIKEVFGGYAARIPISATKALHGHLMGATGALEFVAAVEAMRQSVAPPTAHLWHSDPECDLNYVPLEARSLARSDKVMSNSFGFGGSNAVLVARRHAARSG
jgi:3-oxoacyl-(acyl-carrier-protein) synthase